MTCGTADKRAFLLEAFPKLREDHIGDSRSCSFEETVKHQTAGKGVHLALNSLADDKLQVRVPLSVRCRLNRLRTQRPWLARHICSCSSADDRPRRQMRSEGCARSALDPRGCHKTGLSQGLSTQPLRRQL